jgi:hypothetical protein
MGFGISYALPVILAGLIAEPGGLLIVENRKRIFIPPGNLAWASFSHGSQSGAYRSWSKPIRTIS